MQTKQSELKQNVSSSFFNISFLKLLVGSIAFCCMIVFLGKVNAINAAIIEKSHTRTFTVEEDYLQVTERKVTSVGEAGFQIPVGSFEAFTIFAPVEGDPDEEIKLQKTLDSILLTNEFGTPIDYELEETDTKNYIIKVPYNTALPFGSNRTINLSYRSYGLLVSVGAVKDVYIPGFPADYVFVNEEKNETVTTELIVPAEESEINFITPSQQFDESNEERVTNIPQEDIVGQTTWAQIGTSQFFEFSIEQEVPASTWVPFAVNTFTLPIPRDLASGSISQKVYYTKFSPEPYRVYLDNDDNLMAEYKFQGNESNNIVIEGFAELAQDQDFTVVTGGMLDDIDEALRQSHTDSADFWEVDATNIQSTAAEIQGDIEDVYELTNATYDFVTDRIDYSDVKKYGLNERQGALATLNGSAAVCMEYSDLFITLMRAQGVPARAAFGYAYGSLDYEAQAERDVNHQWAEVYIPEIDSWIPVDTTWGEYGDKIIGGDLNHFYSHVASIDPETPSTSQYAFFGSIDSIPERYMQIDIVTSLDEHKNNEHYTQDKLIEVYPTPVGYTTPLLVLKFIDGDINNFLEGTLNIADSGVQNGMKIGLGVTVMGLVIFYIVRHRQLTANR